MDKLDSAGLVPMITGLLPDIPRWVEARHLVLHGIFDTFGIETTPELAMVLRERGSGSVFVIGRPSDQAVLKAISGNFGALVAETRNTHWLSGILCGWTSRRVMLYRPGSPNCLPPESEGDVRLTDLAIIERFSIDPDLLAELQDAATETQIAASFVGERPVSFCYPGAVTETLWDVSIDTVEEFRRQGHAARVAAFTIRHMAREARRAVWAAFEDNPASWCLAEKLGFEVEDEIVIYGRGK